MPRAAASWSYAAPDLAGWSHAVSHCTTMSAASPCRHLATCLTCWPLCPAAVCRHSAGGTLAGRPRAGHWGSTQHAAVRLPAQPARRAGLHPALPAADPCKGEVQVGAPPAGLAAAPASSVSPTAADSTPSASACCFAARSTAIPDTHTSPREGLWPANPPPPHAPSPASPSDSIAQPWSAPRRCLGAAIDLSLNLLAAQRQLGPDFDTPRQTARSASDSGAGAAAADAFDGRIVVVTGGPITAGPGTVPLEVLDSTPPGAKPGPAMKAAMQYVAYLAESATALEAPVDIVAGGWLGGQLRGLNAAPAWQVASWCWCRYAVHVRNDQLSSLWTTVACLQAPNDSLVLYGWTHRPDLLHLCTFSSAAPHALMLPSDAPTQPLAVTYHRLLGRRQHRAAHPPGVPLRRLHHGAPRLWRLLRQPPGGCAEQACGLRRPAGRAPQ
jgi:hypothetical protein